MLQTDVGQDEELRPDIDRELCLELPQWKPLGLPACSCLIFCIKDNFIYIYSVGITAEFKIKIEFIKVDRCINQWLRIFWIPEKNLLHRAVAAIIQLNPSVTTSDQKEMHAEWSAEGGMKMKSSGRVVVKWRPTKCHRWHRYSARSSRICKTVKTWGHAVKAFWNR